MKHLLALTALLFSAVPSMAATWVVANTDTHTTNKGWAKNKRLIHYVDVTSVVQLNGVSYFNRKVAHWKNVNGYWQFQFADEAGNSRVICDKKMLMIASEHADGSWQYRQSNGEWWSRSDVYNGVRWSVSPELLPVFGYNLLSEYEASHDRLAEGFYRIICQNR